MKTKKKTDQLDIITFDSIAHCAGATGIPRASIQYAKRSGCPAFVGSRVVLGPLLRWLFKRDATGDENLNWNIELRKVQTQRERLKLAADEGRLADKAVIKFGLSKVISAFFNALDRLAKIEIPPAAKGLDEADISKLLTEKFSRLKEEMRTGFQALADAENKTED